MNNYSVSKFSLSYYSLVTQIIIINLITALIGFIFVCFFNLFLLNNNNNIEIKMDQMNRQVDEIVIYLEKHAIFKIPQFDNVGELINFSDEPQLDPYVSQLYIENKYLNQPNEIKIYNADLIKYVDTKDLYILEDVIETTIGETYKNQNILQEYKKNYLTVFNYFQKYFDKQKINKIAEPATNDINLIIETIKQQKKISKIFSYGTDVFSFNIVKPLNQDENIYGAILIRGFLSQISNEIAFVSFNLFNLFLIIMFIIFLLSLFFVRSIIHPIKTLSSLVKVEQDKFNNPLKILKYPIRNDEIGRLSNDIQNMSIELKSQINELEKFGADVAHELKNPLANLKTSNELLSENKIRTSDKKLLFHNIIKDIDRMNRLISDISEYTRMQVEVEKQKFNAFELIEFITDLKSSFEKNNKKIQIIFEPKDSKIMIHANVDKLAQVFINLIENAISFSPKQSSILIQQDKENQNVIIYLTDQGGGIAEKLKDKIFDRFYTDRNDINDYHTGLGLSISKKIMESFGGSLELYDKLIEGYNGACFKLELPIKG